VYSLHCFVEQSFVYQGDGTTNLEKICENPTLIFLFTYKYSNCCYEAGI